MPDLEPALPAYGAGTPADVLPAVATALGHPELFSGRSLTLPAAEKYVVLLIDGLGADLLAEHRVHAPYLSSLAGVVGTAGLPSTTATSLASFGTGLTPAEHGMIGYTTRIPGTDEVLNQLRWNDEIDPFEWQQEPTAFERLTEAGVDVTVISKPAFESSGLTGAALRGGRFVGVNDDDERIEAIAASVAGPGRAVTYAYVDAVDHAGHGHGVDSSEWREALRDVDELTERIREVLPPSCRLLVTADHGMIDCADPADRIDIDEEPELLRDVVVLAGEARFRMVFAREGCAAEVLARWRNVLGGRAIVLSRDEAIERGWFGPVADRIRPRIGDVVVACLGETVLLSSLRFPVETRLVGFHGSLTGAEMRVPILID